MEKFTPKFTTPKFIFHCGRDTAAIEGSFSGKSGSLTIRHENVNPKPLIRETDSAVTVLLGSPVLGEGIEREKALARFAESNGDTEFIRTLNGEFLFLHWRKDSGAVRIVNDRYTSIPLHYHANPKTGEFSATPYFSDLWEHLDKRGAAVINQESFFEFLWFQRVLGEKTHLRDTFFLPDASILDFDGGQTSTTHYWQRSYGKNNHSLQANANQLACLIRQAIRRKTGDGLRYGHFLSGGMDSRSVLAAFPDDRLPTCFTATIDENREFRTARQIAATKGAPHVGLELDPEHYGRIIEHSSKICGGMYNYDNGLFYGFDDVVSNQVDACFHGHGFDYMFQGMYIPGRNVVVGGRTLYLRFMQAPSEDLVSYFIGNASYRTKRADIRRYLRDNRRGELNEFLHSSVDGVLKRGKALTNDPFDLFEYLTFHHISRHYSYPNHASIATFVEQRTVSFDNELFDFYLSLPTTQRFNGRIEKETLKILDPRIARIWSANTDLPVTASCWRQTVYQLAGAVRHRLVREEEKPEWMNRTWPSRDDAPRQQESLRRALRGIFDSGVLENLDFLNLDLLDDEMTRWINGEDVPSISGDFIQVILSAGTFLRQRMRMIPILAVIAIIIVGTPTPPHARLSCQPWAGDPGESQHTPFVFVV